MVCSPGSVQTSILIRQVDVFVDIELSAQRRETRLESKNAIIGLVPAGQDQPFLALVLGPANGLIDHSVRGAYMLEGRISASEIRIHVTVVMQIQRGSNDLTFVFSQKECRVVWHLLEECQKVARGKIIAGQRTPTIHGLNVKLVELFNVLWCGALKNPHILPKSSLDVLATSMREGVTPHLFF